MAHFRDLCKLQASKGGSKIVDQIPIRHHKPILRRLGAVYKLQTECRTDTARLMTRGNTLLAFRPPKDRPAIILPHLENEMDRLGCVDTVAPFQFELIEADGNAFEARWWGR